jgi:hypothetical protein
MFEDLTTFLKEAKSLPDAQRNYAMTKFIFWSIAQSIYYIGLAITCTVLGRRLIHAFLTAWRELKREPS